MKAGKFKIKMPTDWVSREGPPSDLYMAIFLLCPLIAERALVPFSSYKGTNPLWGFHPHDLHPWWRLPIISVGGTHTFSTQQGWWLSTAMENTPWQSVPCLLHNPPWQPCLPILSVWPPACWLMACSIILRNRSPLFQISIPRPLHNLNLHTHSSGRPRTLHTSQR